MKGLGMKMGYILGILLVIPLIIFVVNTFFLKGNDLSVETIDNYIQNSETITMDVPKDAVYEKEQFIPKLQRRSSSAFIYKFTFYSEECKKYFKLIAFSYIEKNDHIRLSMFRFKNVNMTVRVNKDQLNSPEYGTQENPIPIFQKDLLSGREDEKKFFHLSDEMYRIYVNLYLNRFASKEDINFLFPHEK